MSIHFSLNIEQENAEMNKFNYFVIVAVAASLSSLCVFVDGSLKSGVKGPPSPPRHIRRRVVGAFGFKRQYQIFWSASNNTGGSPVNYTVKLCLNDSLQNQSENNICKNSSSSACRPTNILSTNKEFYCILRKDYDFSTNCAEFCNYTICVVASNDVGSSESCVPAPYVNDIASVTPHPPLDLSVKFIYKTGEIMITWKEQEAWKFYNIVYTVLYHVGSKQQNKTKEITNRNAFTRLFGPLEAFTTYCVYLMAQFLNREGVRSAHSQVLGPQCVNTPPGEPTNPPEVVRHHSEVYPDNANQRNVTVEWKWAKSSSWKGTPLEYRIYCDYHVLGRGSIKNSCAYSTDAVTNRTVLQGLNSKDSYNVFVKICNKAKKCSSWGRSYLIKEIPDNSSQPIDDGKFSDGQIALIVTSVLGLLVSLAIFCFCFLRKWRRETERLQEPLRDQFSSLDPVAEHDYNYVDSNEDHPTYDLVHFGEMM